jgi:hypothetical protein
LLISILGILAYLVVRLVMFCFQSDGEAKVASIPGFPLVEGGGYANGEGYRFGKDVKMLAGKKGYLGVYTEEEKAGSGGFKEPRGRGGYSNKSRGGNNNFSRRGGGGGRGGSSRGGGWGNNQNNFGHSSGTSFGGKGSFRNSQQTGANCEISYGGRRGLGAGKGNQGNSDGHKNWANNSGGNYGNFVSAGFQGQEKSNNQYGDSKPSKNTKIVFN